MPKYSSKPYSTYSSEELSGFAGEFGFEVRQGAAGQLRLYKGGQLYSRASAARHIRSQGVGKSYRGSSGRFLKFANVEAILAALESRVPLKDWGYTGTFLKVVIPAQFTGTLERMKLFSQNASLIVNAMNVDIEGLLQKLQYDIQDVAYTSVTRHVYNVKPEIIRYQSAETVQPNSKFFAKNRTDELRLSAMTAVRFDIAGAKAELVVDLTDLAPHWIWVEKGHRVVFPGGVETGTIVGPRPFVEQLMRDVYAYVSTRMVTVIEEYGALVTQRISDWVAGTGFRNVTPERIKTTPSKEALTEYRALGMSAAFEAGL